MAMGSEYQQYMKCKEDSAGGYTCYWDAFRDNHFLIIKQTTTSTTYYKGSGADNAAAITERDARWAERATLTFKEYCELRDL